MRIWDCLKAWKSRIDQRHYYWFLTVALLLPNVVLSVVMQQVAVGRVLSVLVMLPVYMLLLLAAKRPGRIYWSLFVLVLLHAFQLVLLTIFSGSVVAVDMLLNLFTSEPDEAGELLSNILWPIIGSLGFYVLTFVVATISARSRGGLTSRFRRRTALVAILLLLIALPIYMGAKRRFPYVHLRAEVYPMSVFYNMYLATTKLYEVLHYDRTSQDFCYGATSERAKDEREVYVLVIGETSRAHSWSLYGYPRETTPQLDSLRRTGGLIAFSDVLTQSNTTYKSVPILLSPADAASAAQLPRVEGLLTAFREAGFYTAFISNQPGNHSYVDFFAMQGDEHHPIRKELRRKKRRLYDSDMLPYLQRLLASEHPKLLVVLHTYGSHFSYRDRYPKEEAFFPVKGHYSGSERDSLNLRNAYDNAVRQTDKFVSSVIRLLEGGDRMASLLYISDHGEDVYDDERERFLHSSPDVSYYQLHVPLLIWSDKRWREAHPKLFAAGKANSGKPISSNSVFHTLLELAGVRTSYRRDDLSVVNAHFCGGQRFYLNDRYECVPIEDLELHEEDVRLFREKGLYLPPSSLE
jgi:putative membrane protein